jgi:hypothetical protein
MDGYRLYCRGGDGKFIGTHEIEAADDGEALTKARAMKLPVKCELWQRDRMIGIIDPHDDTALTRP